MNVYLYLDRGTVLHRLDPRAKIVLLLATFVLAFAFDDPLYAAIVLLAEFAMAGLAQAWANVRRVWTLLLTIAVVTAVLFSFASSGQHHLFWVFRREGVLFGLAMAIRLDILVLAGIVFLSTVTNEEIAVALVKLGLPYRMGFAVSTALRLVPTILGTALTISQAQRARGLDLDTRNPVQRLRRAVPIIVPVFMTTVRSTQVFTMALESKGFAGRKTRTSLIDPKMTPRDVAACVMCVLVCAAVLAARWHGIGRLEGLLT